MEKRFLLLMEIILKNILRISKTKYKKELRDIYGGPITASDFYDRCIIKPIENSDTLTLKTIDTIDNSIYMYFEGNMFKERNVRVAFSLLKKENFIDIDPLENKGVFNKQATAKILTHLWHYYYDGLCEKKEKLTPCNIDNYIQELAQSNLVARLEVEDFREAQRIVDKIRIKDVKEDPDKVELIYSIFIKKFIETDMTGLPQEEFDAFIDVVYYLSDIFDQTNDVRSYNLQAVALNSLNKYYGDDFSNIDKDNIRRLIGFIYGITIAVKNNNTRSSYYIRLSENGNIITTKEEKYEETQDEPLEKLDICYTAMKNVVDCHYLKKMKLGKSSSKDVLKQKQDYYKSGKYSKQYFSDELLERLELAALWSSDMAAIHKVINEKGGDRNNYHLNNAKKLHEYCGEVRLLLVKVYKKRSSRRSKNRDWYIKKAEAIMRRYAKSLSNLAGIKEVEGNYFEAILDRCVIHKFFESIKSVTLERAEERHIRLALKNLDTEKVNTYRCSMDYNVLMFPLFSVNDFRNMNKEMPLSELKNLVKTRDHALLKNKLRFHKESIDDYISLLDRAFRTLNVSCLKEELISMIKFVVMAKSKVITNDLSVMNLFSKKTDCLNMIKKELYYYLRSSNLMKKVEKQEKNSKK